MDITNSLVWIFNTLFSLIGQTFNLLDCIKFSGISLLDFIIFLNIISVVIPLLFARLKSNPKAERGKLDSEANS